MFCLEGFYDGKKIYVTDVTPRFPYICSYAYPKVIKNYPKFILSVMRGDKVLPELSGKYSVQIGVYTDSSDKWKKIDVKQNYLDWVAFRRVIKKNNNFWFVPGDPLVAAGISSANNLEDAALFAIDVAKNISAVESYDLGYDFYMYLLETLEKGKKLGYRF